MQKPPSKYAHIKNKPFLKVFVENVLPLFWRYVVKMAGKTNWPRIRIGDIGWLKVSCVCGGFSRFFFYFQHYQTVLVVFVLNITILVRNLLIFRATDSLI